VEFIEIAGKPVPIPGHIAIDDALRERFHRGHVDYVAPTEADAPAKVVKAGPAAVAAWVESRAALAPLTKADLAPPPADVAQPLADPEE
jgi:hypothetical protein